MEHAVKEIPVIGLQLDVQFGGEKNPRVLRAQTHIASDATIGQINALLDKVAAAQDRQVQHYELVALRQQFADLVAGIEKYEGDLALTEETARARWELSGKRGEWTEKELSGSEKNARLQIYNSISRARDQARALAEKIEKMEATVGTRAFDGRADRDAGDPDREVSGLHDSGGAVP